MDYVKIDSIRYQGWTLYACTSGENRWLASAVIGKGRARTRNFRCVLHEQILSYEGSGEAATEAVKVLWDFIDETRETAESFFDKRGRFIGEVESNQHYVWVRDKNGDSRFHAEDRKSLIKLLREYRKLPKR